MMYKAIVAGYSGPPDQTIELLIDTGEKISGTDDEKRAGEQAVKQAMEEWDGLDLRHVVLDHIEDAEDQREEESE